MTAGHSPARFAIVLTHNRPEMLARCVTAIAAQVGMVLVVDNASDPPATTPTEVGNAVLIHDPGQPPNLARLWNRGLDAITHWVDVAGAARWDVALLCDDAITPAGWVDAVSATMRRSAAAAGCTHAIHPVGTPLVKTAPDGDLPNRMTGWAFVLRGEAGLRADESMAWWWCDTDLDWQARHAGGMVIAPGPVVPNERPNDYTYSVPGLAERAGRDRQAFAAKWGSAPW